MPEPADTFGSPISFNTLSSIGGFQIGHGKINRVGIRPVAVKADLQGDCLAAEVVAFLQALKVDRGVGIGGEFDIFGKDFLCAVGVLVDPVASPGVELQAVQVSQTVVYQAEPLFLITLNTAVAIPTTITTPMNQSHHRKDFLVGSSEVATTRASSMAGSGCDASSIASDWGTCAEISFCRTTKP